MVLHRTRHKTGSLCSHPSQIISWLGNKVTKPITTNASNTGTKSPELAHKKHIKGKTNTQKMKSKPTQHTNLRIAQCSHNSYAHCCAQPLYTTVTTDNEWRAQLFWLSSLLSTRRHSSDSVYKLGGAKEVMLIHSHHNTITKYYLLLLPFNSHLFQVDLSQPDHIRVLFLHLFKKNRKPLAIGRRDFYRPDVLPVTQLSVSMH